MMKNQAVQTDGGSEPYDGRYAMSSCMSCHGAAEFELGSFLLPSPAACKNERCRPTQDRAGRVVYYRAGSDSFRRWFQDRSGDDPMNPPHIATDYGMNYAFKALPAWYRATGQQGDLDFVKGDLNFVEDFNDYRGLPHR